MTKELEKEIKSRSRFQFTDPFGKGRIRNLVWEYDVLRKRKNEQIEWLKDVAIRQAEAVNIMVIRTQALEKENKRLQEAIKKGDEARKNLAKKLAIAESELASMEMDYINLKNKQTIEEDAS